MSRVQILDVGDRVTHNSTGRPGVVVSVEAITDGHYYTVDWGTNAYSMSRAGWSRSELTRVGGALQIGDLVKVEGEVVDAGVAHLRSTVNWSEAVVTDVHPTYGEVAVVPANPLRNSVFRTSVDALTRITRAEALA